MPDDGLLRFPPGEEPLADREAHAALFDLLAEEVAEEEAERLAAQALSSRCSVIRTRPSS